jgi:hypothetical protein
MKFLVWEKVSFSGFEAHNKADRLKVGVKKFKRA